MIALAEFKFFTSLFMLKPFDIERPNFGGINAHHSIMASW